ncbi:MAG: ornithine cyclodeaminase family protein [Anaerolineae bacterium]
MRLLSRQDVQQAITMAQAIEVVKEAFAQLSAGEAVVPLRTPIEVAKHQGTILFMPAYLEKTEGLAVKIVSVFPGNLALGLPTIHALVVVADSRTGQPLAAMEGSYLTALRTGAASGAATDLLAREEAKVVACFGAGAQARTQLQAVCQVRDIQRVWVKSRTADSAQRFAHEMRGQGRIPADVRVAASPAQAVREADIVITATTSSSPVFDGRDLRPGTHINAIGSFTPQMQEVDETTIRRAKIVVDSREACLAEAGDLIIPLRKGLISEADIHAELGEIVLGRKAGRESPEEVTYFKSVGNAVQDAAVASFVLQEAEKRGLGVEVSL